MKRFYFLLGPFLVLFLLGFAFVVSADYNDKIDPQPPVVSKNDSSALLSLVGKLSDSTLTVSFPYERYLDIAVLEDIQALKKDLQVLDQKFPFNIGGNRKLLSIALTEKLYEKYEKAHRFQAFDAAFLIHLMQWAEKFQAYAEIEKVNDNDLLYGSIYGYWISKISDKLTEFSKENHYINYTYKYKYLKSKCDEKQFSVSTKICPVEKVAFNLLGNHWSHLLNASWNQASITQLFVLSFLALITLYGYFLIAKKLIKRNETR